MRRRLAALAIAALALAGVGVACTPNPTPPPPAPSGDVVAIIHEVFGPYGVGDKAVRVAQCESGLNPFAQSPGGTYKGLFQLGPHLWGTVAHYGGDWFNPFINAQVARDLYLTRGNWSAWPHCGRR